LSGYKDASKFSKLKKVAHHVQPTQSSTSKMIDLGWLSDKDSNLQGTILGRRLRSDKWAFSRPIRFSVTAHAKITRELPWAVAKLVKAL